MNSKCPANATGGKVVQEFLYPPQLASISKLKGQIHLKSTVSEPLSHEHKRTKLTKTFSKKFNKKDRGN